MFRKKEKEVQIAAERVKEKLDIINTEQMQWFEVLLAMVGTLVEVGLKVRDSGGIPELLDQGLRADSGMTVPAKGLILWEVYYR